MSKSNKLMKQFENAKAQVESWPDCMKEKHYQGEKPPRPAGTPRPAGIGAQGSHNARSRPRNSPDPGGEGSGPDSPVMPPGGDVREAQGHSGIVQKRLDAIRADLKRITPFPWAWEAADGSLVSLGTKGCALFEGHILSAHRCKSCQEADTKCLWPDQVHSDFIAKAPETMNYLLEMMRIYREHINDLERKLDYYEEKERELTP